jgi:hypothetical protein
MLPNLDHNLAVAEEEKENYLANNEVHGNYENFQDGEEESSNALNDYHNPDGFHNAYSDNNSSPGRQDNLPGS